MLKNVCAYIICACVLGISAGYTQQIQIISSSTGEPVSNVALFNANKTVATLSDEDGIVQLSSFAGSDSVFFQHTAFLPFADLKSNIQETVILDKRVILIDEFVVSATKSKESTRDVALMVDVLTPKEISEIPTQSSAELLLNTGNVIIQKSQGGGGSPILRGFEANKILLVVDGVRMNNAIYRNGHLQNSITLDNQVLERVEVTFGPTPLYMVATP
jgi:hemoglobin/transferrin/lactoferrin receptor protein